MKELPVQPGDIIDGKLYVERLLGHGGMGAVFVARHLLLDQPCVIKIMFDAGPASSTATARFLREMRAAAKLSDAHVARMHDCGTLERSRCILPRQHRGSHHSCAS
jgi:serine/threonine protein kinase